MMTNTSQAPWVNFVIVTIDEHDDGQQGAERVDRCRLRMTWPRFVAARRAASGVQCRTMPVWPSVNETKTPMM